MRAAILVLNAGSSSLKFSLYAARPELLLCCGQIAAVAGAVTLHASDVAGTAKVERTLDPASDPAGWPTVLLDWIASAYPQVTLAAAAHRVVHGGPRYTAPVLIDAEVLKELRRLTPLAPLHQPHALDAIATLMAGHPALPQIACFDTAFHHTLPLVESSFSLPRALTQEGLRRYGFHGLSYEYIAGRLPEELGARTAAGRVVVAHLGAGASMCALLDGRSIATTMSLTPLDGLPMATRCGAIDPGAVLYLLQEKGLSAERLADLLYHDSGLFGVSGISGDMQVLLASDAPAALEAVDLFVYRIGRELGSLAAALGGLDALVFTGGIGEHAAQIRQRVCEGARWLGIEVDTVANAAHGPRVTRPDSRVSAWVIPTDEDDIIMRHTHTLLQLHPPRKTS
ncbi:acetate/propionate family kinase [Massilia sp. S19_KUP03_FR1]|uniref:acetate/propionate family kinase n=1 Tax=Massilia sp. S19_KUP03_FR1 TaxID=3025503 RepID=UPI002FCD8C8F